MARALTRLGFVAALACACSPYPTAPGAMVTQPDPTRAGVLGYDGPRGAALVDFTAQARVTDALKVQVIFPARVDGSLEAESAPYPAVVFVQDAAVTRVRYRWLAAHMATRGYVVILPDHPFNLAMLDADHAVLALRAVRDAAAESGTLRGAIDPSAPAAVVGHGLGGVVAARQWAHYTDFSAVAVLAAYPADADYDAIRARRGANALLMAGTADVPTALTRVQGAFTTVFEDPKLYAQVDALNHYAWTDDTTGDELASDGPRPPTADARAETRRDALTVLDLWLDSVLRRDADATASLATGTFHNVTLLR